MFSKPKNKEAIAGSVIQHIEEALVACFVNGVAALWCNVVSTLVLVVGFDEEADLYDDGDGHGDDHGDDGGHEKGIEEFEEPVRVMVAVAQKDIRVLNELEEPEMEPETVMVAQKDVRVLNELEELEMVTVAQKDFQVLNWLEELEMVTVAPKDFQVLNGIEELEMVTVARKDIWVLDDGLVELEMSIQTFEGLERAKGTPVGPRVPVTVMESRASPWRDITGRA
ncbi:hypothetical protein WN943_002624 [Citrus x changshan-huyou]